MGMASFRIAEQERQEREAQAAAPVECPMPEPAAEEAPKAATVTAKARTTSKG